MKRPKFSLPPLVRCLSVSADPTGKRFDIELRTDPNSGPSSQCVVVLRFSGLVAEDVRKVEAGRFYRVNLYPLEDPM